MFLNEKCIAWRNESCLIFEELLALEFRRIFISNFKCWYLRAGFFIRFTFFFGLHALTYKLPKLEFQETSYIAQQTLVKVLYRNSLLRLLIENSNYFNFSELHPQSAVGFWASARNLNIKHGKLNYHCHCQSSPLHVDFTVHSCTRSFFSTSVSRIIHLIRQTVSLICLMKFGLESCNVPLEKY